MTMLEGLVQRTHSLGSEGLDRGDIVRCEREADGIWFYCCIDRFGDDGVLLCTVVESQSWPDLALGGILPGRTYAVSPDRVLSIVRTPGARPSHLRAPQA
jgi:hypothetical protein